jgi:hypothetical protein
MGFFPFDVGKPSVRGQLSAGLCGNEHMPAFQHGSILDKFRTRITDQMAISVFALLAMTYNLLTQDRALSLTRRAAVSRGRRTMKSVDHSAR